MARLRQKVQQIARATHVLAPLNSARYFVMLAKSRKRNSAFRKINPDFLVPPKHLAYDAYSAPDWTFYKKSGEDTAVFLASIAQRYLPADSPKRVYEWGCDPGRVIRHIGKAFGPGTEVFGTDYNLETIAWCTKNLSNETFSRNDLHPPLSCSENFFDFLYCISVLTHLSEQVCHAWVAELYRVMRPGGVAVMTTQGDAWIPRMMPHEVTAYCEKGVVIRGKIEEGKKLFLAVFSPAYVRQELFKNFEVLEFQDAFPFIGQNMWVLRKPL